MGNKQLQSKQGSSTTTILGHHKDDSTATGSPRPPKSEKRKQNNAKLFLNPFSIQSIGKVLSFNRRKKHPDAVQAFQPPMTPNTMQAATSGSFQPLDFSEMAKIYDVDFTESGFLGSGHYASVYRGVNKINGQRVAVKKVDKKLTRLDSLKSEVEALRKVAGHPNIVELFDVYLDENYMYLVLELLAGGELFDRIVSGGAYSERDAALHMKNIGSALAHMHSRGIVHRDLKPENLVLVDSTSEALIKISDFGLSKILKEDEETMMTICGTKAYSAPEVGFGFRQAGVARTDSGYSAKVDMWSLGVILYVIVAAYHPFDPHGVDDDRTIWSRIVTCKWDFNDRIWDSLSDALKDLLRKLIEPDPEKRLSAEEFLAHPWITDASTPVRPLPSLTKTRSSRYWRNQFDVQAHAQAAPINAISEGQEVPADKPATGVASDVQQKTSAASTAASSDGVHPAAPAQHVDDDHNIV